MTAVEKVLVDMEGRGRNFLDDMLRIGRVFDLMNQSRVQREFEEQVVADAPVLVERRVSELIDWLVDQDLRQWQALSSWLAQRRGEHPQHLPAIEDIGAFQTHRRALLDSVGREAQRVVETFDRRAESRALADGARTAVAATAAMGASALGLGALVTALASTAAVDVSGILAASILGAVGMLILPAKRRRAGASSKPSWPTSGSGSEPHYAMSSWPAAIAARAASPTAWRPTPDSSGPSRRDGPMLAPLSKPGGIAQLHSPVNSMSPEP